MKDNEIEKLRLKIDDVDSEILNLLSKRSGIVSEIGEHKSKNTAVVDLNREEMVLNRLLDKAQGNLGMCCCYRRWMYSRYFKAICQYCKFSGINPPGKQGGLCCCWI